MTIQQFNYTVKSKFGSVRRFCILAGIEDKWPRLRVLLAQCYKDTPKRAEERKEYYNIAMRTSNKLLDNEIPTEDRKWLNEAFKTVYGGVSNFVDKYPHMPKPTVRALLNGRTKTKTQAYETLMQTVIEDLEKL